jgi:hypothetical protein
VFLELVGQRSFQISTLTTANRQEIIILVNHLSNLCKTCRNKKY